MTDSKNIPDSNIPGSAIRDPGSTTQRSRILVVDDEELICLTFKSILVDNNYDVMTARDYETALKIISDTEPDLIVTDIVLGSNTGVDLLNKVKSMGLNCPVVMITGQPSLETSINSLRLGAFDYIPKPVLKDALLHITRLGIQHKNLLDNKNMLEMANSRTLHNIEAIFKSIKDGIITVNNELKIIETNKSVKKICNFTGKDNSGENLNNLQTKCSGECVSVLKETLKTNKIIEDFQIECQHSEKPHQVVLLTSSPLRHEDIKTSGAVLVIRDITRLTNLELELKDRTRFHNMIGKNSKMRQIHTLIKNLADTDSTALIVGETGTGKELVAQAIHHTSIRKTKPFVTVNCSALSENLLESELFGHVKGAFTGAIKNKVGRFEKADRGTIFLDEIGDISPLTQLKLLRVLQEKTFERVGDSIPIKADVRIIAATNCNLKEKIKTGEFREDLYYRIKVVDILVPSLAERREDIPLLLDHFLNLFNKRFNKQINDFSNEVVNLFMNYSWPGNIRELRHAVEHGFVLCQGKTMLLDHLPVEIKNYSKKLKLITPKPDHLNKDAVTKEALVQALNKAGWNKAKAARILNIGRRTIYRKIQKHEIQHSNTELGMRKETDLGK